MTTSGKYIELLMEILSIPALSREEQDRANFLERYLEDQGFCIDRIHHNLLVTTDGNIDSKTLLINSHMDTVKANAGWTTDPFIPSKQDDRIIALGSNDAGASVVSLIASFTRLAASGKADKILLAISAEEEVSGKKGMEALLPHIGNISFAIVGEPTGMKPAVAERGLMVIDGLAKGKSGHAARNEGINSIYMVMEDIKQIKELQFLQQSDWLPDPSVNVTMINAGTNHNVVPGECTFVIDARSNDVYPNEKLLEIIQSACKTEIKPRSLRLNASSLSKDHPVYKVLDELNLDAFGSSTMSDMALLPVPAIKIGPGDSARSHTANEYILLEEIDGAIGGYSELIDEILKVV